MFHVKHIKTMNKNNLINKYIDILLKYNKISNLVSRKLNNNDIKNIIEETFLLNNYINNNIVIDAGSGNGLLGIPIGILNKEKKIILVETKEKKVFYLKKMIRNLELRNITVYSGGIDNYFVNEKKNNKNNTLVARGFPNNYELFKHLKNNEINELILITIEDKVKKIKNTVDNIKKYVYNIPSKDNLKIIKLEKVSRETVKKL